MTKNWKLHEMRLYMSKRLIVATLVIGCLGLGSAMQAMATPLPSEAWFNLSSPGDTPSHGVYVGPYQAFMNTYSNDFASTAGLLNVELFCVDAAHESHDNDIWYATITPLVGGGSLDGRTRGGDAALEQYKEAAWLADQFASNPTSSWAAIHSAIWEIMGDNSPFTVGDTSDWIDDATDFYDANPNAEVYGRYAVVTPENFDDRGSVQEYLTPIPHDITVPEPPGLLLMGMGLVGLAGLGSVRRRHPRRS